MTTFAYNNNKYKNIEIVLNEILKNYFSNLKNVFENKMLNEKTSFVIEQTKNLQKKSRAFNKFIKTKYETINKIL